MQRQNKLSSKMVSVKCPVCRHGRLFDVHRNRVESFRTRLTEKTSCDGIKIKCQCCKKNITIKI